MHASFLLHGYRIDNHKYLTFETGLMMLKFICHDASHGQSAYEILHKIPDIMSVSVFFQVLNTWVSFLSCSIYMADKMEFNIKGP